MMEVKIWTEEVIIPTYGTGTPEKNPMFLEKRVYQGSSGVVYPHPVVEKILDEKEDRAYTAAFLENEYLKIMILPELGGRIQMAYDKIRQRHFVYYNQVIKPALVGLAGPWISGGIEFNWPQHHRPSTFEPVDFTLKENEDGSKTVWVHEAEKMFHTRGMAGFTLYPGKAFLEIKGKLHNPTPFPQTFLWWANPAVKVNDHYQSVFPPDVHAVFDHGKRAVSSFPIATGEYYKVNYAPGTDISWYKNIPVPTSYMAVRSEYDFIGGYEHDAEAGVLHVADHHVSTGKKQWTWGNGDFGQAWDRNLTDEDGPYIELMTGMFTDNQPDFSWLQPNETRTFSQYFMPYARVGLVKNATREAMLNLEQQADGSLAIKVYATALYEDARIRLSAGDALLLETTVRLSPEHIFEKVLPPVSYPYEMLQLTVTDREGRTLVSWQPAAAEGKPVPPPAVAAPDPAEVENNELLYLHGLHLEQYRHATYSPVPYYEEALRRDPGDARNNNALGLWYLRRGKFEQAAGYFQKAIDRLTLRNPNAYDGEPFYNLGWALMLQGRLKASFDAFYKAAWSGAWNDSALLSLARIAAMQGNYAEALELAGRSLEINGLGYTAHHLKVILLRSLNRQEEALESLAATLQTDPFNYGCRFEQYLLLEKGNPAEAAASLAAMKSLMDGRTETWLACARDYIQAGFYREAILLLQQYAAGYPPVYPLVYYYMSWCYLQLQDEKGAMAAAEKAAAPFAGPCFPNHIMDINVLRAVADLNKKDARGLYYLGNLWYDKRQYEEAISCWEQSAGRDASFPTVFRNLALAYHNKRNAPEQALEMLEKAFSLDTGDARVLMELDQLYKKMNRAPAERLALLERHLSLVEDRDDLYLERITLYNQLGQYGTARQLLAARKFHPWEGGEGKVVRQYLICHLELGRQALLSRDFKKALLLLQACEQYPHNLGEGKLYGTQENDIHYLQGCALEGMGALQAAKEKWQLATRGISEPVQAIFYNDPQPDKIFYQGMAWEKLGEAQCGQEIFKRFVRFAEEHMQDHIRIDYFAVSLPDLLVFDQDLDLKNRIHCLYLQGLGYQGLRAFDRSEACLREVLALDVNHQGAQVHLNALKTSNQAVG
ncbi:DUF5107 domain-containing protein [Compostibacter hankyongensis]|uniref:DUF5107 domain-containing protein n=1 Tax=Compostibacter hankyongensis TaxID=1007089 RepID=A0ABP8FNM2_9BACT